MQTTVAHNWSGRTFAELIKARKAEVVTQAAHIAQEYTPEQILQEFFGVDIQEYVGGDLPVRYAYNGAVPFSLRADTEEEVAAKIAAAEEAFNTWRDLPITDRASVQKYMEYYTYEHAAPMMALMAMEMGKPIAECYGEVLEMVHTLQQAYGAARTGGGQLLPSERPGHTVGVGYKPLGPIGAITPFNFPIAIPAWTIAMAMTAGDPVVWKPSELTSLVSLAWKAMMDQSLADFRDQTGHDTTGLFSIIFGALDQSKQVVADTRLRLISATGSTNMITAVAQELAKDPGRRRKLEGGGNNALVFTESVEENEQLYENALTATVFGALALTGQRCTSTRRLLVPDTMDDRVFADLQQAYDYMLAEKIGDPRDPATFMGPLNGERGYRDMVRAAQQAQREGGKVYIGGQLVDALAEGFDIRFMQNQFPDAAYVKPLIIDMRSAEKDGDPRTQQTPMVLTETFAPVLYFMSYHAGDMEQAIEMVNATEQKLASAIFTRRHSEAARFQRDVRAGVINVNTATIGAEMAGPFGGQDKTGGDFQMGSRILLEYQEQYTATENSLAEERPIPFAQGMTLGLKKGGGQAR